MRTLFIVLLLLPLGVWGQATDTTVQAKVRFGVAGFSTVNAYNFWPSHWEPEMFGPQLVADFDKYSTTLFVGPTYYYEYHLHSFGGIIGAQFRPLNTGKVVQPFLQVDFRYLYTEGKRTEGDAYDSFTMHHRIHEWGANAALGVRVNCGRLFAKPAVGIGPHHNRSKAINEGWSFSNPPYKSNSVQFVPRVDLSIGYYFND